MTWFKVDDGFWSHPKTATLSDAAVTLWVRAGSYCCQHLTDGCVARGALRFLGTESAAEELVAAALWDAKGDGWVFHDWSQYQPSRESVLDERASNSARQAVARNPELRDAVRRRDGNNCRYCGQLVEWNNKRGGTGGTYDHVIPKGPSNFENLVVCCRACNTRKGRRTPAQAGMKLIQVVSDSDLNSTQVDGSDRVEPPTRPDPTRPSVSTDVDTDVGPRKRGTRLQRDWEPATPVVSAMRTERPDIDLRAEHDKFIDYWTAKPGKDALKLDWEATWRNWMRNAKTPLRVVNGHSPTQSTSDRRVAEVQALKRATPTRMELE